MTSGNSDYATYKGRRQLKCDGRRKPTQLPYLDFWSSVLSVLQNVFLILFFFPPTNFIRLSLSLQKSMVVLSIGGHGGWPCSFSITSSLPSPHNKHPRAREHTHLSHMASGQSKWSKEKSDLGGEDARKRNKGK